jgi:hypothetical protein
MSITDYANLVNSTARLDMEKLSIYVEVKDIKQSYGRWRALVTPISGSGETWVSLDRLTFPEV